MVRYFHIRDFDQDSGEYYPRGGKTVAFTVDRSEKNKSTVKYAFARCSTKDNFARKVGRELSEVRLNAEPLVMQVPSKLTDREAENLLHNIIE